MPSLYLIDGMGLVFRAYHAITNTKLKSPTGEPTGALFGFTNIITSLLDKENPTNIVVVFDRPEPTFRHIKYEAYKANRTGFPEDLVPQLIRIKKLIELLSIPQMESAGYEADDIIGTLAKKAAAEDIDVFCLTVDKDYYQLVNDRIKVYKPGYSGNELEIIDYAGVEKKFGVHPDKVIDVLAIIGDTSDNIPGVKGIGEKTAIPLVQQYGSVEAIYENIEQIASKSVKEKFLNNKEMAFLSKELVTIELNTPVEFNLEKTKLESPKYDELDKFFQEVNFNTIRKRWAERKLKEDEEKGFIHISVIDTDSNENKIKTIKNTANEYLLINTDEKFISMITELQKEEILSFDLETSSLDRMNCEIVGLSFSVKEEKGYYIPVHYNGFNRNLIIKAEKKENSLFNQENKNDTEINTDGKLPVEFVLTKLKPLFENHKIGKIGQNCKFDTMILRNHGIKVRPIVFDTMVGSFILNSDNQHNLDALSLKWLNYSPVSITTLIGEKKSSQKSMAELAPEEICDYACEDADLALRLKNIISEQLKNEKLYELAVNIEFPIIEVLTEMEFEGIGLDTIALKEISEQITGQIDELRLKIHEEAGMMFNIDSPKQLGHVLFEKLMIPTGKKTKTGFSTDVQVLSDLAGIYPIAQFVLDYRQLVKLKSTYVDALPKMVNPNTNRIHTTYNQTVAATGRLSSNEPNLQNIPIRSSMGKEIRKAFAAQKENCKIMSADYSQIELRIMAFMSEDRNLIEAFKNKLDIHSATAAILYGVEMEKVDSDQRRIAKTVNFGIMYGLGSFGLSQRLGIPRKESQWIITNYFEKYPGIKNYIEKTIEYTREMGFAETVCKRRRYFNDINSNNHTLRTAAERACTNMPIQGTASDMMKIAMIKIYNEFEKQNIKSKMLLQVHDELVFEVYNDEIDKVTLIVKDCMENALPLGDVPIEVEIGIADNWLDAH